MVRRPLPHVCGAANAHSTVAVELIGSTKIIKNNKKIIKK